MLRPPYPAYPRSSWVELHPSWENSSVSSPKKLYIQHSLGCSYRSNLYLNSPRLSKSSKAASEAFPCPPLRTPSTPEQHFVCASQPAVITALLICLMVRTGCVSYFFSWTTALWEVLETAVLVPSLHALNKEVINVYCGPCIETHNTSYLISILTDTCEEMFAQYLCVPEY